MIEVGAVKLFKKASVSDADIAAYLASLNKHFVNDFGPIWDVVKHYTLYPDLKSVPKGIGLHALEDDATQAGELGVHELTPDGFPIEHVFVNTCLEDGESWTVCGAHEAQEAAVDPDCNLCVEAVIGGKLSLVGYETSDPVEADKYGFDVDGVLLSNFATPQYFIQGPAPVGVKYDFKGVVKSPFEILDEGYLGVKVEGRGSWTQLQDMSKMYTSSSKVRRRHESGRRFNKRLIGRHNWQVSMY